jgi:hypothetical protein
MPAPTEELIAKLHRLYCEMTGQPLSLHFDRQRLWFDWLRAGYDTPDLRVVILYLQKEIRHQRRNVGALKLSNLLQPDRFEEDLCIRRAILRPPTQKTTALNRIFTLPPEQQNLKRQQAQTFLSELKKHLR